MGFSHVVQDRYFKKRGLSLLPGFQLLRKLVIFRAPGKGSEDGSGWVRVAAMWFEKNPQLGLIQMFSAEVARSFRRGPAGIDWHTIEMDCYEDDEWLRYQDTQYCPL